MRYHQASLSAVAAWAAVRVIALKHCLYWSRVGTEQQRETGPRAMKLSHSTGLQDKLPP